MAFEQTVCSCNLHGTQNKNKETGQLLHARCLSPILKREKMFARVHTLVIALVSKHCRKRWPNTGPYSVAVFMTPG